MCDTVLAPPGSSNDGAMLFGKNSDRQRNEPQSIQYFPPVDYFTDCAVTCTYLAIPQVSRTYGVLVSRPFWSWGAEMGVNEHGVVIGNEGLHSRRAAPRSEALTGLDLLRLALERAANAPEAVDVITSLLQRHGQGGNCGHLTADYYNNGFLIADANDAYVLETIGCEWLLERVNGARSLSNVYSIEKEPWSVSEGISERIRPGRDALESRFHERIRRVMNGGSVAERQRIADQCWQDAIEAEDRWLARLPSASADDSPFQVTWSSMNRLAGFESHAEDP